MATEMVESVGTELERAIERERERFGVPGCAVAVVRAGEVIVSRGFGLRDVEHELPVTDRTLFAIGSSTKAFTSSLLGALVDDGLVEWDRPVRHYLPGFRMHDPVAGELLTVRDMLSHRSGLPRHDMLWYGNRSLTREELVRRLEHLPSSRSFREAWQYNNLMYITAGYLAGTLMGCSWEEGVRRRLFEPLGMDNTNFSVDDVQASPDHSRPYGRDGGRLIEVPFLGVDFVGPAGTINSCIADMTRWVTAQVDGGAVAGRQVISPAALRQLHAPTMVLPDDASDVLWPEAANQAYALGWFVMNYRGHRVLHHGGNIDGFAAMVSLLPEQRAGVVVLTNLHPTGLRDVVPYLVFDQLLGLEPLPWGERYHELYESMLGGMKAAAAHKKASAVAAPPSHPLDAYAGRYHHPGYGDLLITLEDGRLVPRFGAMELSMEHLHYETWGLQLPIPDAPPFDMTFDLDASGAVSGLRVPFEMTLPPTVFERQPDERLSDPALLRAYTGSYVMGPLRMSVELETRGTLVADIVGQGRIRLQPKDDRVFSTPDAPGLSFEFVRDGAGAATSCVVDPAGIFTREGDG